MIDEVRFALRALQRRPLFTLVAVASIAIGIGANTAILSVFNRLLLRPPDGVGTPERVVELGRTVEGDGFGVFSYPELRDMQAGLPSLDVAGWRAVELSFTERGPGERLIAMMVSASYFNVLGTQAARGRFFHADEDRAPGTHPVVVISHSFWRDRLGSDPGVLGRTLMLNRQVFTVVGVTAPEFRGHLPMLAPAVYLPLTMFGTARRGFDQWEQRGSSWVPVVGRLAPGASLDQANAELNALYSQLSVAFPDSLASERQRSARAAPLTPVTEEGRKPVLAFMSLLLALVLLILLTTCANVAGMLLARAAAREREVALRLALGSSRLRLVRLLLTETLVVFSLGGIAGVALGWLATSLMGRLRLPLPVPVQLDFTPDPWVGGVAFGLALLTGITFGLLPALQASTPDLLSALKCDHTRGGARARRGQRVFVTGEVGLTLLLLISAGLLLRSLQRAGDADPGFEPRGVRIVSLDLAMDGYDEGRGKVFLGAVLERLESTPGVDAVAAATDLPLDLGKNDADFYPEGWTGEALPSSLVQVTPGYFRAAGVRLLRGRGFTQDDSETAPGVVIVSRLFAERAWPGRDPIGRRIRWGSQDTAWATVVGVAGEVKNKTLMEVPQPMLYLPLAQRYDPGITLLVRSTLPGARVSGMIRTEIAALDPRLSLTPVQSLEAYTALGVLPQRAAALLSVTLGVLALLLSALGVYGVIALAVTRRTREIGVRLALGAERRLILRQVLGDVLRLSAPGLVVGALGALGLGWLMRAFILGVSPVDPLTFAGMPLLLLGVILLAGWVPARRAARLNPLDALRTE